MKSVLLAALLGVATAQAAETKTLQVLCEDTSKIYNHISSKYKEKVIWTGLDEDGYAVVITANDSANTYTIMHTLKEGISCVTSAGKVLKMN